MSVLLVEAAKLGEILTAFELQPARQVTSQKKGLLKLHHCLAITVDLENDVGLGIKIRIDRRT